MRALLILAQALVLVPDAARAQQSAVWIDPAWQSATVQPGQVRRASIWFERQYVDRTHDYVARVAEFEPAPRSAVRRAVMDTLRAIHERSWAAAARTIQELERAGEVANCSRHWIVNSVACDVPGGDPSRLSAIPGASRIFLNGFGRGPTVPASVTDPRARPDPDEPYRPDPARAPWYAQFLGVDRVWSEYGLTGRGVLHVVHDFGWTLGPPTIRSTLWLNPGEVADNGLDDEGNGYVDDIHGYNFDRGNGDLTAPNAGATPGGATHGDLTAALMAGRELVDTALVVGIAPDSRWAAVVNRSGIEASIEWALLVGADTYSMSFSIPNLGELRSHWRKVMEHASLAGLFLASGAGNFADSTRPGYVPVPVQMRIPEDIPYAVFGVSGVGRDGRRPSFASQGPVLWQTAEYDEGQVMKPDFATVNTNLLLFDGEGRKFMPSERGWSGNSFAGPITAGIIALMLEADPELTPWRARDILVRTARDVEPAGVDAQTGAGVIDAWAAVTEVMRERREREAARGG